MSSLWKENYSAEIIRIKIKRIKEKKEGKKYSIKSLIKNIIETCKT